MNTETTSSAYLTREDIVAYIRDNRAGKYNVTTSDGRTRTRRLFVTQMDEICEFAPRSTKRGHRIADSDLDTWTGLSLPAPDEGKITAKFARLAAKATFPSEFVRRCLKADTTRSPYENRLTTGTRIDGEVITLNAIEKAAPGCVAMFRKALAERRPYTSHRFRFRGYDGSLHINVAEKDDGYHKAGDVCATFAKEYRGCGNGYYYALVNDDTFIGCDID